MKKLIITSILLAFIAGSTVVKAQNQQEERLGLPGDNLNLYGVMKLFRESETLEGFEKALNDEKSKINNLDLDGNNYIDYIRVIDNVDNNVHTIVLQVPVSKNENQDVAVFTVQRDNDGKVFIQLIGDEDLYGKDYIIEPIYDDQMAQTPNPGFKGNDNAGARRVTVVHTTAYETATWPLVRYIYLPGYMGWRSSWYYDYYPSYWQPWTPYYWDYYYGFQYNWYDNYYSHYRRWNQYRYSGWNDYYYVGHRQRSVYVYSGIQKGTYKATYSRPEQRRDGEADFAKMYPSQSRRSTEATPANRNSNTNRNSRRTTDESSKGVPAQNAGTSRRSTETQTVRTSTQKSTPQSNTNRRSTTTAPVSKSSTTPAATQRTESRSSAKSTKAVKAPASTTTRRSSTTTTTNPAKKSEKTETTKSSRR